MKIFQIVITLFIVLTISLKQAYAQKLRKEDIYQKGIGVNRHVLFANLYLDDNNNVVSKQVVLAGQDWQYTQISVILISFKGSAKELYNFMNKLEKFYNDNKPDTYDTIEGKRVRRARAGVGISDIGGTGEVGYDMKSWSKIKEALINWAKSNNESLE